MKTLTPEIDYQVTYYQFWLAERSYYNKFYFPEKHNVFM